MATGASPWIEERRASSSPSRGRQTIATGVSPWIEEPKASFSPRRGRQTIATGVRPWIEERRANSSPRRGPHRLYFGRRAVGHTFTKHLYHIVYSTKDRKGLIGPKIKDELYQYMCGIARNTKGQILQINGVEDHVHHLTTIRPSIAVAELVGKVKTNSSGWVSKKFPRLWDFEWQSGYSSFTVSESNFEKVAAYIQKQEEHHRELSFEEELRLLLERHGVEFDPEHYLD